MPHSHRRRLPRRRSATHDRRSNERSASAASEPFYDGSRSFGIDSSWIDGPNRPTPSTAALRRLQDKRAAPQSKPSRLDLEEAFGLVHEALEGTHITAIPCLGRSSDVGSHFSVRDLPFMVFDDLDKKLFRSTLKDNVYLTWANMPRGVRGRTSRPGLHGRPRITIKLSLRLARDRAATLGVLLHQMIHAYYLQSCGHKNKGVVGRGHDLRHEEEFENLRRSIKEHFLPGENSVWDAANDLLPVEANVSYYPPEAGCSDCYYRSSSVKRVNVDRWRMAALALAIARSARRVANGSGDEGISSNGNNRSADNIHERYYFMDTDGSSSMQTSQAYCPFAPGTFITLVYMKRWYPIRKQDLHDQEGLSKIPSFVRGGDYLFIPLTASVDDLGILYSYLRNGEVAPTRAATRNFSANALPYGSSLNIIEKQGPPVMFQPMANSAPYLAASIAAYKLGNTLHFESLKNSAINRLYSLPCSSEDPIHLLEQVYHRESGQDLALPVRIWAKDWLARPTDASLPSEYATHTRPIYTSFNATQNSWRADATRSQGPAGDPHKQRTWLPGHVPPFPQPNRSDQWPYQSNFEIRFDELLRKGQELEAAQRQYILDVERGTPGERPGGSSQHGQIRDADLASRMRDTTNKKYIDSIAPRHTTIDKDHVVTAHVEEARLASYIEDKPKHDKNLDLDTKKVAYNDTILIKQTDAQNLSQDEEITLINWENAYVRKISHFLDPLTHSTITALELEVHLQDDFKATKQKLTWLFAQEQELILVELVDFDYLIIKDLIEKEDKIDDCLTEKTKFRIEKLANCNVAELKADNIIQFERKEYFRVDRAFAHGKPAVLFAIPTGKATK